MKGDNMSCQCNCNKNKNKNIFPPMYTCYGATGPTGPTHTLLSESE